MRRRDEFRKFIFEVLVIRTFGGCDDKRSMKSRWDYSCRLQMTHIHPLNFMQFQKCVYIFQLFFNNFSKIFREINSLLTSLASFHETRFDHNLCGKINVFSVKSTFLLKKLPKLLKSWFHGKFLRMIVFYSTFPHYM